MAKIKLILKISLIIVTGVITVWVFLNVLQINFVQGYSAIVKDFDIIEKLVLAYKKTPFEISPEDKALVIKAITQLTAELLYYQDSLDNPIIRSLFTKEDIDIMINNIKNKITLLDNYEKIINNGVNETGRIIEFITLVIIVVVCCMFL